PRSGDAAVSAAEDHRARGAPRLGGARNGRGRSPGARSGPMMRITNTLSGQKEEFAPRGDVVRFYVCGMTPKFHPHVGHARIFVAADIMRRYLEYRGLRVRHVQNFTDIDDKIIARAADEGGSAAEVAQKYTDSYREAM